MDNYSQDKNQNNSKNDKQDDNQNSNQSFNKNFPWFETKSYSQGKPDFNIEKPNSKYSFLINILLFIATFFTTTLAGAFWANKDPYQLYNFPAGLTYSILLLTVISTHEFGHYFAARFHKINVTLPYYIPFPFLFLNPFGTMGAVIKMKTRTQSRKSLFDIGIAGPIAGWVTAMTFLLIGYFTLPPISFIMSH